MFFWIVILIDVINDFNFSFFCITFTRRCNWNNLFNYFWYVDKFRTSIKLWCILIVIDFVRTREKLSRFFWQNVLFVKRHDFSILIVWNCIFLFWYFESFFQCRCVRLCKDIFIQLKFLHAFLIILMKNFEHELSRYNVKAHNMWKKIENRVNFASFDFLIQINQTSKICFTFEKFTFRMLNNMRISNFSSTSFFNVRFRRLSYEKWMLLNSSLKLFVVLLDISTFDVFRFSIWFCLNLNRIRWIVWKIFNWDVIFNNDIIDFKRNQLILVSEKSSSNAIFQKAKRCERIWANEKTWNANDQMRKNIVKKEIDDWCESFASRYLFDENFRISVSLFLLVSKQSH